MKTKRIISIVLIALVAVLSSSVIACAFIPKNFNLNLSINDINSILIYKEGNQYPINIDYDNEHFDDIISKFNQGFDSTVLGALFQGKLFGGIKVVDHYENLSDNNLKKSNKIFIEFRFSPEQQTNLFGHDITLSNDEQTYNSLVFEVVNSHNLVEVKATLRQGLNNATHGYISYFSYAAHANLYNYINENLVF